MKKALPITAVILALAAGIFFWKGCKISPVPDRRQVDSVLELQQHRDSIAATKIASLKDEVERLTVVDLSHQRRIDSLTTALSQKGAQLNAKAEAYRQLVARGNAAASRGDSQGVYRNADTLRTVANDGLPVITQYIDLSDSTVREYAARMAIKDSIIARKDTMIITWATLTRQKDTTISVLQTGFNHLYDDDVRKTRYIKALKPAAIAGAAIIAAEIIFRSLKK